MHCDHQTQCLKGRQEVCLSTWAAKEQEACPEMAEVVIKMVEVLFQNMSFIDFTISLHSRFNWHAVVTRMYKQERFHIQL